MPSPSFGRFQAYRRNSYNKFHMARINAMIEQKDTPQNDSGNMMNSSQWSEADRLHWAIGSFSELELLDNGKEALCFNKREKIFETQIKTLADAKMWYEALYPELVGSVQKDADKQ